MVLFIAANCAVVLIAGAALGWRLRALSTLAAGRRAAVRAQCVAAATARAGWAANAIVTLRWYTRDRPALLEAARAHEWFAPRLAAGLLAAAARGDDHVDRLGRDEESVSVKAAIGLAGEALEPFGVRLLAPADAGSAEVPGSVVKVLAGLLNEAADRTRAVRIIGVSNGAEPALTIDLSGLHRQRLRQWRDSAVARLNLAERTLTVSLSGGPR